MTQIELIEVLDLIQELTDIKIDWYEHNEFDLGQGNHVWKPEYRHLTLNLTSLLES